MSDLKELSKKNIEQSKKLTPKNHEIYTDIDFYLMTSALDELEAEEILQEIIGMFLEAQQRGEDIKKVIGDDYQAFCDSLIESAQPKRFTWQKVFRYLEIVILGFGCLWLINLVSDYFPQMIINGRLIIDYQVNLGFLLCTAINILAAVLFVDYIGKKSFKLRKNKDNIKNKLLLVVAFVGIVALNVLVWFNTKSYVLFSLKVYYIAAVIIGSYLLVKVIKKNFAKLQ
jgi:DNA-binding ferritin-like protein (Dps family)